MNDIIFDGKTLQDLLQEIHGNTTSRRFKILETIDILKKLIKTVDDIVVVAPILKDYFDVLVRSDDHVVKIATIVQRVQSAVAYQGGSVQEILSEAEKAELLKSVSSVMSRLEADVGEIDRKLLASEIELPVSGSWHA